MAAGGKQTCCYADGKHGDGTKGLHGAHRFYVFLYETGNRLLFQGKMCQVRVKNEQKCDNMVLLAVRIDIFARQTRFCA